MATYEVPSKGITPEQLQAQIKPRLNVIRMGQALSGKHVYGGTVPWHVTEKRRVKNKMARKSRRHNRGK